jgi:hypothetical protein
MLTMSSKLVEAPGARVAKFDHVTPLSPDQAP